MSTPSVFISYSHKDKEWVTDYLLTNLEKNGIPCHIDYRDFEIGKPSLLCMEEAIETCEKTILVYTPNWINSEFAQFEAVMLQTDSPLNFNKKILPLMLLGSFAESENYLNQAVDGLREAGQQQYLPLGLFARATLFRHQNDFPKSWTDLDEAYEIIEYGQMRLHLTDYHLEACRTINAQLAVTGDSSSEFEIIENGETLSLTKEEMQTKSQEHFKEAERLVNETGYHRRDEELKELKVPTRLPIS